MMIFRCSDVWGRGFHGSVSFGPELLDTVLHLLSVRNDALPRVFSISHAFSEL